MERGESVLDALLEEEDIEDVEDVEMIDVEDGELIEDNQDVSLVRDEDFSNVNAVNDTMNVVGINYDGGSGQKKNKRKKKKKKKRGSSGPTVTDINWFVIDACRRLKERKSYLVWSAVGCLGVAALNDLLKEVDAIQAHGGQKTADGRRHRNGGGILWNIIKVRDPNAYKEIMRKGKEFEKQFNAQKRGSLSNLQSSFRGTSSTLTAETTAGDSNGLESRVDDHPESQNKEKKRLPVHDRLRIPVSYDDLVEQEAPKIE